MSKRRKSSSIDYLEGAPVGAFLILLFAARSYIKKYWYIFLIIAVAVVAVLIFIKIKRKKSKKTFAIDEIDAMDGIDFEEYTAELLRRMGYKNVRVTQASGDFGVDVTAKLNDEIWVFQCKRYTGNLGVKAVQEVFAGAAKYHADKAVVVTNSYFTAAAEELAEDTNVMLWDRDHLCRVIKNLNKTVKSKNSLSK